VVPRSDAAETVTKTLQPAVRYSLDDITELPPVVFHPPQQVPLGERQREVYRQMQTHAAAMLKEGTITAANSGIVFSKLLQVSLGWVYDAKGEVVELDGQERIKALIDVINSAERKVLVFSPFKATCAGISKALEKAKIDYAQVTGDTPGSQRSQIFGDFQQTTKYKVINAHPDCMAHGLTLTAADTVVWFGPVPKLETYEQANARITRVGQAHKQQVIRLVGTPVEKMVYKRLAGRQDLQTNVLDLLAELTAGEE
jgi:SNF2 family DNA or RNA helicase